MGKCIFCKWYKDSFGNWVSECTNENSEYCGGECIEKVKVESSYCDDKETD